MKKMITLLCALAFVTAMSATVVHAGKSARPETHANLTWEDYPKACLNCHNGGVAGDQYAEMMASTHYTWMGEAPDMVNGVGLLQGKLDNAVNSYCISMLGDWPVCGSCHVGRGLRPDDPRAGPKNVDCLMCHSEEYATQRVRLPDGSMGVVTPTDTMVQNISMPTRATCLKCHAYSGGGDAVKRGDLSEFTITNSDPNFDVHMNTTGPDLSCQACHVFKDHKTIGKGSDIRPTDDLDRGSEVNCATCHVGSHSGSGHSSAHKGDNADRHSDPADRHLFRVSCQACHVDQYAKVATEVHRDWRTHHDGVDAEDCTDCAGHPDMEFAANLTPEFLFWNRLSDNYLLYDDASPTYDPDKETYTTSRPMGDIRSGKLTPFKYKTAAQPLAPNGMLVALDTWEYLAVSGNVITSVENGLANMESDLKMKLHYTYEDIEWVNTDTYQMINHGVAPADTVDCEKCHGSMEADLDLTTDSMLDAAGYKLKDSAASICSQCHAEKSLQGMEKMHEHITKGSGIGCYFCHDVARPERGLCSPCDSACVSEFVDNTPYQHECSPEPDY